jgi:hypothetical protein
LSHFLDVPAFDVGLDVMMGYVRSASTYIGASAQAKASHEAHMAMHENSLMRNESAFANQQLSADRRVQNADRRHAQTNGGRGHDARGEAADPKCYKCGAPGHKSPQCPVKAPTAEQAAAGNAARPRREARQPQARKAMAIQGNTCFVPGGRETELPIHQVALPLSSMGAPIHWSVDHDAPPATEYRMLAHAGRVLDDGAPASATAPDWADSDPSELPGWLSDPFWEDFEDPDTSDGEPSATGLVHADGAGAEVQMVAQTYSMAIENEQAARAELLDSSAGWILEAARAAASMAHEEKMAELNGAAVDLPGNGERFAAAISAYGRVRPIDMLDSGESALSLSAQHEQDVAAIVDTGASSHVVNDISLLSNRRRRVLRWNTPGGTMVTNIVGDVVFTISLPDGSASREITLSEVAYSPSAPCCLISALLLQDQCGLTADIGSMVLRGADGAAVSPLTNHGGVCMLELRAVQRSFASSPTCSKMAASATLALRRSTRERVLPARLRLPPGAELVAAPTRLPTPALAGPAMEMSTRSVMDRTRRGRLDTSCGPSLPPADAPPRPPTPTIRPSAPVLAPRGAEARVSAGAAPVGFSDVALSTLLNDLDIDPANVTNLCAAAGTDLCAKSYYGDTAMSEVWEDGHFFAVPSKMAVEPVLRKAMLHWTRAPRTTSFTIGVVSDSPLSPSCEKLLERFAVHRDVVCVSPSIRFYVLSASDVVVVSASDHLVLHLTLGHPGHAAVRAFRESGLQVGFPVSADFARVARDVTANCSACRVSKQLRPSAAARLPGLDDAPFRAWFADTKGALMTGVGGVVHAYMMVDQVSGYAIGVAVPDLSGAALTKALDVCMVEIQFLAMEAGVWPRTPAVAHTVSVVRILQTDLAKSFTGGEFKARCATIGIAQRFSSPYLHENQATVETAWRPVFNCARAMMVSARVPLTWWPHAFLHAIWLRNGMPRASGVLKGRSPLSVLTAKQRDFTRASIFGAPAVAYIDVSRQREPLVPGEDPAGGRHRQLAPRAKELRYVGNDLRSNSYKLVDVASQSVVQLHGMVKVNEKAGIAASVRGADFWLVPLSMDFDVRMPPEGLLGSAPVGDFTVEGVRVVLHPEDREYYAVIKVCARQDVHTTVTGWVAAYLLLADSVANVDKVLEYIVTRWRTPWIASTPFCLRCTSRRRRCTRPSQARLWCGSCPRTGCGSRGRLSAQCAGGGAQDGECDGRSAWFATGGSRFCGRARAR